MSNLQVEYSEAELLASDPIVESLLVSGVRCHGGLDADGVYRSPRTRFRKAAIDAWQARHREQFGTDMLHVPLDTWPESYPNVMQAKLLLREGVRDPIITVLTRIGTVEGFGALIRHVSVGDPQRFFVEPIAGTAIDHLQRGLFEAHARDEAGWAGEAGHQHMWYAARDVAFERPLTEDQTAEMLLRLGLAGCGDAPDSEVVHRRMLEARAFHDLDFALETTIQRMIEILLIEVQAYHVFAWAEELLADTELVAGAGEAARIVSYIRQDETPHVEYLRTTLTEMRDRTFVGESGRRYPGAEVIGELWSRGLGESLGSKRDQQVRTTTGEVERALERHPRRDHVLDEFHALGACP